MLLCLAEGKPWGFGGKAPIKGEYERSEFLIEIFYLKFSANPLCAYL